MSDQVAVLRVQLPYELLMFAAVNSYWISYHLPTKKFRLSKRTDVR